MWYVRYVHNPGVHGRFNGLDIIKEMVVLENKPRSSLDGKKGYSRFTRDLLGQ